MSSADGWGYRGEDIIPSARKSIHSHSSCPFASSETAMEPCGIEDGNVHINTTESPSTLESGYDEVDNISNHAFTTNAVPIVLEKNERRHSFHSEDQKFADEISKILSKSLPENFAPHLYSSHESCTEENGSHASSYSPYQSFGSNQSLIQRSNIFLQNSYEYAREPSEEPAISETHKISNHNEYIQTKEQFFKIWHVLLAIIFACVVYGCINSVNLTEYKNINNSESSYDKRKFYNDMSTVGKMYKLDKDDILQLQVGISSISEKEDTDSFIFVYDSEKYNFNSIMFNDFINEIATISARYLRNESASARHIVIDTTEIVVKNSEELIHKYSDDITRGGVMVMRAVDMLPSSLAMALHYYCDVFNPLVKKSAIFFTMDIANCSDKTSTHYNIEKCLKSKWSSVSSEFIDPLLARVVSVVVDVTTLF